MGVGTISVTLSTFTGENALRIDFKQLPSIFCRCVTLDWLFMGLSDGCWGETAWIVCQTELGYDKIFDHIYYEILSYDKYPYGERHVSFVLKVGFVWSPLKDDRSNKLNVLFILSIWWYMIFLSLLLLCNFFPQCVFLKYNFHLDCFVLHFVFLLLSLLNCFHFIPSFVFFFFFIMLHLLIHFWEDVKTSHNPVVSRSKLGLKTQME